MRQGAAIRRLRTRRIAGRLVRGRQITSELGIIGVEAAASFEQRERIERSVRGGVGERDALFVVGAGGAGERGRKDRSEESQNQEREQGPASGDRVVH